MDEKCKPSYRNLNTIKSYSEQKYATVQWCQQNCENDEYLKREVDQLKYLTPPAVRQAKKITEYIDYPNSYGCSNINETQVGFKKGGQSTYYINFNDDDIIQVDKSNLTTCEAKKYSSPVTTTDENNNTINVLDSEGNQTYTKGIRYELPTIVEEAKKEIKSYDFGTINLSHKHNSSWYIGFNKAKSYYFKPNWLGKNEWRNSKIPSVVRAQTFKVPKGKGGKLKGVDLGLEWSGSQVSSTGSPIYVQLWNTYKSFRTVQNWNTKEKKMEYSYIKYNKAIAKDSKYKDKQRFEKYVKKTITTKKGKKEKVYGYRKKKNGDYVRKREYVQWLGHNHWNSTKKKWATNVTHPLAQATYTKVGDNFPTITFDTPYEVKEGESYAIVLFSPLSEWKHCPRWKGWGRNCKKDNKYPDGYAFMSENNGRVWKRYGKDGTDTYDGKNLTYKQGKYTPQDFMFQCRVENEVILQQKKEYYSPNEHTLYLEPIYDNPITHVSLSAVGNGFEQSDKNEGKYLVFEISTDGDTWTEIIPGTSGLSLQKETNTNEYPHVLLVRARMWRDDDKEHVTPFLESITINLTTLDAKEFYARTKVCTPRTDNMLGANLWGRLYAPFELESGVDCNVEIIEGSTITDHIYLKTVNELDESLITELELDSALYDKKDEAMATYLTSNPEILETLKKESIYILPTSYDDKLYLLSFAASYNEEDMIITGTLTKTDTDSDSTVTLPDGEVVSNNHYDWGAFNIGGISFSREVAYPISKIEKEGNVSSENTTILDTFREWIDYTFDYEKNQLIFKESTLDDLTSGSLAVTYYPIFISRLTQQEVGRRIDKSNNTVSEGLVLDYFKETITVTSEHVESRRIPLRVRPVDPIREVLLFKYNRANVDDYISVYENYNYTLNTIDDVKAELVFEISSVDGASTMLDEGDIIQIVYTPSLEDASLYAGYYATRTDTSMQCKLNDMYWEYKV